MGRGRGMESKLARTDSIDWLCGALYVSHDDVHDYTAHEHWPTRVAVTAEAVVAVVWVALCAVEEDGARRSASNSSARTIVRS
jgi:hypothetical protein